MSIVGVLLLLVAPLWLWNYREYGSIVTTQESIDLAAKGPVLEALATAATTLDWTSLIDALFVPGRPWVGGWSFLPMNQALRIARMGGSVSLLGIPTREAVTIERFARDLIFKGLTLQAIIGRRIFSTWDRMLELLADGLDVRSLVSHEYEGLDDFIEGMEAFDAHEALKVVFYPHGRNGDA